jgi:exodeoxyribonuclease VII small subunit
MVKTEQPASTFEEKMDRLQAILSELDNPSTPLQRTVELYEQGVAIMEDAVRELSTFEAKVKLLRERAEGVFDVEDVVVE